MGVFGKLEAWEVLGVYDIKQISLDRHKTYTPDNPATDKKGSMFKPMTKLKLKKIKKTMTDCSALNITLFSLVQ